MKNKDKSDSLFLLIIIILLLGGSYIFINDIQKSNKNALKAKDSKIKQLEEELDKTSEQNNELNNKKIAEAQIKIKNLEDQLKLANEKLVNQPSIKSNELEELKAQILKLEDKCTFKKPIIGVKKVVKAAPKAIIAKKIEIKKEEPKKVEEKVLEASKHEPKTTIIEEKSQIFIINNNQVKPSTIESKPEPTKNNVVKPRMPIDILK